MILISGCVLYESNSVCKTCGDNFDYVEGKCEPLEVTDSCLRRVAGRCTQCKPEFYPQDPNANDLACLSSRPLGLSNCKTTSSPQKFLDCLVCNENAIPWDYQGLYTCHTDENLALLGMG